MKIENELDRMIRDYSIILGEIKHSLIKDVYKMILQDCNKLKALLPTTDELNIPVVVRRSEQFSLAEIWKMAQKNNCDDFIKLITELEG